MRRKEKEIIDKSEVESIVKRAVVCRIALCDDDMPYIVPVNFGYEDEKIYIHCAHEGKKLDIIKKNNNVCFEVEEDLELVVGDSGCNCTMKYTTVIGTGKAYIEEGYEQKQHALQVLCRQTVQNIPQKVFSEKAVESVTIIRIDVENMTGKRSK